MQKLPRRSRLLAAAAVTGALLVPAALLGGAQAAISAAQYAYGGSHSQYGGSGSQYQYRVQICHRTGSHRHPFHTITVSARAAARHLRRHDGDHLGPCTGAETLTPKHHHGKGHGHGHDRDEQGGSGTTDGNAPPGHGSDGREHH